MNVSSLFKAAIHSVVALSFAMSLTQPANAQSPASAKGESGVDLNLVLAVDASGSVDNSRFQLQKQGYAAAFRNPKCKIACNIDPLRGLFASNSDPL
jgi:hypothetical protein